MYKKMITKMIFRAVEEKFELALCRFENCEITMTYDMHVFIDFEIEGYVLTKDLECKKVRIVGFVGEKGVEPITMTEIAD